MSQPVRACEPGLGDLSKPTAPAYFFGLKLMFVGVMNFSHVPALRFIVVKIFSVIFLPIFGHLDSVKLTSLKKTDIEFMFSTALVGLIIFLKV